MPRYPITEQEVEDMRRSGIPAPVQRMNKEDHS